MAFTIYLDDSGTDPNQPVANATALIISAGRILAMEKELAALKSKEEFTDFHTSEFVHRNSKSEFANWSRGQQKRVFRRMRQITRKYVAQIFSLAVNKDDYDSIVPATLKDLSGRSHYAWALRHVVPLAQTWRIENPSIPPYEWVFDWMEPHEPARKEVEAVMEQAEEQARKNRNVQGECTNFHFRPRASLAGLQCADLVAWTNYQFSLRIFRNKPLHPFARLAWDDFQTVAPSKRAMVQGRTLDWNHSLTIKRDHLRDWAQKEAADGRAIEQFRAWAARKQATQVERSKRPQNR